MKQYNFKKFNKTGGRFTPAISIVKPGAIGLNAGFCKRYSIDNRYVAANLYFDTDNNAIAVKPLTDKEPNSASLRVRGSGAAYISAKSFLEYYGIDMDKHGRKYVPEKINDPEVGSIFVINLNENNEKDENK